MSFRESFLWSACVVAFAASVSAAFAGVHFVSVTGQGEFTAIPPAVDAANDDRVTLVRSQLGR